MKLIQKSLLALLGLFAFQGAQAQCNVTAAASSYDIICGDVVSLSAIGDGVTAFGEDFNSGSPQGWSSTASGVVGVFCGSNSPSGTDYLWFGGSSPSPRFAETPPLDLSNGGSICFYMRYSNREGGADCEDPDAANEGVHLQYNIGAGWVEIDYWDPNGGGDPNLIVWNQHCRGIPPAAETPNTRIRWVQLANTGDALSGHLDHWGIEDVEVITNNPNASYTWAHTGITKPTGNTPDVQPIATTTYSVTYTDGVNTCNDNLTVNVVKAQVFADVDKTQICPGDPINFTSTSELLGEVPQVCGYTNDLACNSLTDISDEFQVGNGTSVNTGGNCNDTPFGTSNCDGGLSTQIIYRANEVKASGFTGGKIKNIQFDIASVDNGYNRANNFKIWMSCTNLNSFGNMVPSNQLTRVFEPKNITFTPGWQVFDLDKAFEWDGQSNILVMICWNNPQGQGTRARTRDVLPGWNCIIQDGTNSAGGANFDCWDDTFFSTGQRRPNTRFGACQPRDIDIDFSWNSSPNDPTFGGLTDQNPSAAPTVTGSYTYTVTANGDGFPAGCAVTDQVTVDVQPAPETPAPTYNVGVCEGQSLNLNFGPTAIPTGASYSWTGPGGYTSTAKNPSRAAATPAMNGTYRVVVSSSAGCPSLQGSVTVTVNPAPNAPTLTSNSPICDGEELTLFSNQPSYDMDWSGPNGWTSTNQNPTRNDRAPDMGGTYTLTLTDKTTGCTRSATINVVQNALAPALPLTTPSAVVCPGEDIVLNTTVDGGFFDPDWDFTFGHLESAWTNVQNGNGAITATRAGVTAADGGTYFLVAQEEGSTCPTDTAFVTITIFDPATIVATNGGPYCTGADIELEVTDAGAGSTYTWTGPNGFAANGRQVTNAGAAVADAGTYSVSVDNGVCANPVVVTTDVVVTSSPSAGTDNTTDACIGGGAVDLFAALGGTPDAGGNWTDNNAAGGLTGGSFTPSNAGTFTFTYTIPASGTCPEVSAIVTVNVYAPPVPGTGQSTVICQTSGNLDLFTLISGTYDAGGTWVDNDGSGQLAANIFDPSGLGGNTYTFDYVLTGTPPCADEKTTVTVEVQGPPNPGTPTDITLCYTDGSINLLDQLTGEDAGGTWTDDNASGGLTGDSFNPGAVNISSLPATFDFTYSLNQNVCGVQSATVSVTVNKPAEAGNGRTENICESGAPLDLTTFISGTFDGGGSWNDLDGSGQLAGNMFNPNGLGGNTYRFEYTVTGNPPCANATTIVTLTVVAPGNPGTPSPVTICSNGSAVDLFNQLTGQTSNGTWSDDNGSGALSGSTVDPSLININSLPATFNFTHSITDLCGTHTATVAITINKERNAGDGKPLAICASASAVNLRNELVGPYENGGRWEDPDGSGGLSNSFFNPAGLGGQTFRIWYILNGVAPCQNDTAEFVITVTDNPSTGTGTDLVVCEGDAAVDLFNQLSGNDAGGVWEDDNNTNALNGSIFNPANVNPSRIPGTFNFTYKIDDGCTVSTTTIAVTINKAPNPGDDNLNIILCAAAGTVDLDTYRSADSENTGSWEDPTNSGKLTGSNFDPTGEEGNTFDIWYIVPGTAPCKPETAFFKVNVIGQADAGTDGAETACLPFSNKDLLSILGGSPDNGGTWSVISKPANTTANIDVSNGRFTTTDDSTFFAGDYVFEYTIAAPAPCQTVQSRVTITLQDRPQITDVTTHCKADLSGYTVTFKIVHGDAATYSVDVPGSFAADGVTYTTDTYPSNTPVTITVSDGWACGTDQITTTADCSCITRAATFDPDTVIVCDLNLPFPGTELTGFSDDGNDVHLYYLHESNGTDLGTIIQTSSTNNFSFDPNTMTVGKTYYVSAAAGDNDGSNNPDENDACYQLNIGTPVQWYAAPNITSTIDKTVICPGENITFIIQFPELSSPDYKFSYTLDGTVVVDTNDGTVPSLTFTESPLATTTYELHYIENSAGCRYAPNTVHNVSVNRSASASLDNSVICSDANPREFNVAVAGDGTTWSVIYTNDFDNSQTTVSGITSAGTTVPVSMLDSNTVVTYSLLSVSDNSGSICPGVVSGNFTVNPTPTAKLYNSDATYCEGEAIDLNLRLTGVGPWRVDLTDDQSNVYQVNANTALYTASLTTSLAAGNYTFTITSVTDLGTSANCTSTGVGSADITINPGPKAQMGFNLTDPIDANPNNTLTICEGDGATIDFQYVSGAGTNFQIEYDHNNVLQPSLAVVPGTKSSVAVPASALTVGTHEFILRKLTDNSPASCEILNVDTAWIVVKPLPTINVNLSNTDICFGETATFTYTASATDPVTFDVYDQNGFVTTVTQTAGNPLTFNVTPPSDGTFTYTFSNLAESGVTPACAGSNSQTITLNVAPSPTATIDANPIVVCQGSPVDLSYVTSGIPTLDLFISLDNGSGKTFYSTTSNATGGNENYQITGLSAGTYTAVIDSVTDGSSASCAAIGAGTTTITVQANPTLASASFSDNPICVGQSVTYDVTLNGNAPFDITFNDGLGNTYTETVAASGSNTGVLNFPYTGVQNTTFTITSISDNTTTTDNGSACFAASFPSSTNLTVNPLPFLQLIDGDFICETEVASVEIAVNGTPGPFDIEFRDNISGARFNKTYDGSSRFISLTENDYNGLDSIELVPFSVTDVPTGCIGNAANNQIAGLEPVVIKPIPTDLFTVDATAGCAPFSPTATFTPSNSYNDRVTQWTFGLSNGETFQNVRTLPLNFPNEGTGSTLSLNYQSIHGCVAPTQTINLTVFRDPIPDFNYSPNQPTTIDYQVEFFDASENTSSYEWEVDGNQVASLSRFIYDFPNDDEGIYEVCLSAISPNSCRDTLCRNIEVKGIAVAYVPNAFTPDNDGVNEVFQPQYTRVEDALYSFQIFNRWGEIIFETKDPNQGWNGITKGGNLAPAGTYIYRISAVSKYTATDLFNKTGHVNLLR